MKFKIFLQERLLMEKYANSTIQTSDIPYELKEQLKELQNNCIAVNDFCKDEDEQGWVENGCQELFHITILYGIPNDSIDTVKEIIKKYKNIEIQTKKITYFDNKEDKNTACVLECESKQLSSLHKEVKSKIENKDKWDKYLPHITIAYLNYKCRLENPTNIDYKWKIKNIETVIDNKIKEIKLGV